jgi:hypothetical protein
MTFRVLSIIIFTASDYSFDHCIFCHYIYGFWLHLWPLYCLSVYLRVLITPLTIVLSVFIFTVYGYPYNVRQYNGQRCNQKRKYNDRQYNGQRCSFWLHLWPLSVIIFTASDYTFDHCIVCHYIYGFWLQLWPLYCLSLIRSRKYNHRQYNGQRGNQKQ